MLKDTTSHGLCVRVRRLRPPHTIERHGEGDVVSKEVQVGEEERGAHC